MPTTRAHGIGRMPIDAEVTRACAEALRHVVDVDAPPHQAGAEAYHRHMEGWLRAARRDPRLRQMIRGE